MQDFAFFVYAILGVLSTVYIVSKLRDKSKFDAIPSVGSSGVFSSYIRGYTFVRNARQLIQEGYQKYPGRAFKIPMPTRWMVVVTGSKMTEEIRNAPMDQLSFQDALADIFQLAYTVPSVISRDQYHIMTVSTHFTKNFGLLFGDIKDEFVASFNDIIPAKEDEWTKVPAHKSIVKIISRTTNRVFLGFPLCRDQDFIDHTIKVAVDVVKSAFIINLFPSILKPIIGRLISKETANTHRAVEYMSSVIQDRLNQEEMYGRDRPDRPNDLISWLLDDAKGEQRTVRDLAIRVLALNFSAVHTTSMGITHALYDLAAYPEYIQPLREEVEAVIAKEGWTKTALGMMYKLDSFLKESHRLGGIGAVTMTRKVMKEFTFSDGTVVPAGCFLTIANAAPHHDEKFFVNADQFDGFRFSKMYDNHDDGIKHQMTSVSFEYNLFGHGRHACPGRFIAVNEMKAVIAYILMTYDVKFEHEGRKRPPNRWVGTSCAPNQQANLLYRKRSIQK